MDIQESIKTFEIESKWLMDRENRLNASSFSPESIKYHKLIDRLNEKGIVIDHIGKYADDIFYPNRFKRNYSKEGIEFLSSKDIFDFSPNGKKIKKIKDTYYIKPNWILITRSGTVGRVLLSNEYLSRSTISEHVIRLIPINDAPIGYLYVYLLSDIGKTLLMSNIFGGVVDEIETEHISNIPIPIIPSIVEGINDKIIKSQELREEAQSLFPEINKLLRKRLNLPNISKSQDKIEFIVKKRDLNLRLDGYYHSPIHSKIIEVIENLNVPTFKLKELTEDIFEVSPFKHVYVDSENGVPFYTSAEILYHRLCPTKYLSKSSVDISKYKIKKGWLLMPRSGDPESGVMGRIRLVLDGLNDVTTSDHVLRIIPDNKKVNPGYLGAFLSDEIYGKKQLLRGSFGKNVPAVRPAHIENALVPLPNESVQKEIGEKFVSMFDKFDKSTFLEQSVVSEFESEIDKIS